MSSIKTYLHTLCFQASRHLLAQLVMGALSLGCWE